MKITIFSTVKNQSILHRRVCVMFRCSSLGDKFAKGRVSVPKVHCLESYGENTKLMPILL